MSTISRTFLLKLHGMQGSCFSKDKYTLRWSLTGTPNPWALSAVLPFNADSLQQLILYRIYSLVNCVSEVPVQFSKESNLNQ